jgi:Uma2 family endonuclease
MVLPASSRFTPDEFLVWERDQRERHIYVGGEVFAMAGGSPRHNRLSARTIARLESGLEGGPCGVFTSDQKLGLPEDDFVYADVAVVCGPLSLRPGTSDVVTNPSVVVEVLSKGTEAYGDKQRGYLALPSIQHFVLVSQPWASRARGSVPALATRRLRACGRTRPVRRGARRIGICRGASR